MPWLIYFIISFLFSFAITGFLVWKNKKQSKLVYRLGGVGIIIAFILGLLINPELVLTKQIVALAIGGGMMLVFGVWDDFKDFSWKIQLLFQLFLAVTMLFSGYVIYYVANPLGGVLRLDFLKIELMGSEMLVFSAITIMLWIVLVINSLNWADGIDGLSGGISLLAALSIFLVSLRAEVNQPAVAILALIFIGAVLGFWLFNFPPGKIEAGTSGSYFMAFVIAAMAIMAGTKIATALIVLVVPIFDAVWVILERAREGKWPMYKEAGKRHLHYKLRSLGWPDRKILLMYLGFSAIAMIVSVFSESRLEKIFLLAIEIVVVLSALMVLSRKIKEQAA